MRPLILCLSLAVACGGTNGDDDDDVSGPDAAAPADAFVPDPTARFFPMHVGDTWHYDVQHLAGGVSGPKVQTVEATETLTGAKAGITAFRLRSDKPSGEYTLSWQEDTGDSIVRHLEKSFDSGGVMKTDESYDPEKLRLDESTGHTDMGASYSVSYTEHVVDSAGTTMITKTEQWTIEAVDEQVTVPAGTFPCLRVHRTVSQTGSDKRYWFARGVGKVREEGDNQIEELTSYSVQ